MPDRRSEPIAASTERRPDRYQFPRVRGKCPRGCGETLFLGKGGYVTCSLLGCPEPDAATRVLEQAARMQRAMEALNG